MDDSDKIDEGYSEGSRSQEDAHSPMKIDADEGSLSQEPISYSSNLQNAVLALGENERKGK